MHRTLSRSLLTFSAVVFLALHPTTLVAEEASGMAEILAQIQKIPHDPNPLGIFPAQLIRLKEYKAPFQLRQYQSLDGTPLAAAIAVHQDDKPHPGVVLAHGFTETKNQKYIVELSALLHQNGWHVLAIDFRGHGDSRKLSQAPITFGWKEADDILAGARFLRDEAKATSIATLGFSMGGRSVVKAMIKDRGQLLQAGIALSGPIGRTRSRMAMTYLQYWQARQTDYITIQTRSVDLLLEASSSPRRPHTPCSSVTTGRTRSAT